jgi:transglutaminase-like putative cysteine protease
MSVLYYSESGRVIPTLGEELTTWRRARKVLDLPPTDAPGTLYLLARPYAARPLRVAANGVELPPVEPAYAPAYHWYAIPVDPALLRAGANRFEFWTDASAMNAWSLAMEAGHAQPESYTSDDGGATWRNEKMGYLNALRGEYVVRVRLQEGQDPPPPPLIWEDAAHPRVASLRKGMPPQALGPGPRMARVRALSGWLASSWEHTAQNRAALYAPWDAETILAWGKARSGHNGERPIVMCVHYAAAFVSCCQAAGIPARCAIGTAAINGPNGHFVAEVWFDEYFKWVMVDPNSDAIFWQGGVPLSIAEIQQAGCDLSALIEWGPGTAYQRQFPHMVHFIENSLETGRCFVHRSLWPRADLLSHPEASPPGHGALTYCETGLVWEARDLARGLGMFPRFAEPGYVDAPPRCHR